MPEKIGKTPHLDPSHAALFRYREINGRYLLTNDAGQHVFLSRREFDDFIAGRLDKDGAAHRLLDEGNFLASSLDEAALAARYAAKYDFLNRGTTLHIVIPTLRCNKRCVYCCAKAPPCGEKGYDMDEATAAKTVDAIFESPSPGITIEFQGGEPLLNWDIVVFIVRYAERKKRALKKNVSIVMVSNLTLLTDERLDFLLKHKVNLCTSLDGPKFIHDRHRPMLDGRSGYDLTTHWMKQIMYSRQNHCNALVTLTKDSLSYPREIIEEYLKWQMFGVPLRPVSVFGYGGTRRRALGVGADEFLDFYRAALDYMIELNEITGQRIHERMAEVCLRKIFNSQEGYLDMRSPCGAGCGQLAYMYDGSVYTCDEARMLGSDAFKLGSVHENSYLEMMQSSRMKSVVFASCTDGLYCDYCVYKPYCGVCPVFNWQECGSLYAQPERAFTCKMHKGMLDYIFLLLQDKKKAAILRSWTG